MSRQHASWPLPFLRRKAPQAPPMPSLEPLRRELEALAQDPVPRTHPRNWIARAKRTADFIGHARPQWARFFRRVNPYPAPFRHTTFRTEDGVTIAAWHGPSRQKADWGLVVVPGMFSTKDDTVHKRRTIRLWRGWNVPVMSIDMRAFGESNGVATAGWKEAFDVHAAARYLAEREGLSRVAVFAESMGGAAALNALAHDARSGTDLLGGGVLCYSAFADARDAVTYISSRPPPGHPFMPGFDAFRKLLWLKSMGGYERFDAYLEDVAKVNGLSGLDEMMDLANPKWKVGMIKQPTLLVHSVDDPVVPIRHARRFERYARDLPHIQVMTTSWGGHTGFEVMDPHWFWEVTRRFFGHVNGVELENLA